MDATDSLLAYNKPMPTGLFKIGWLDVGRGLLVAIFAPIIVALTAIIGSIILAPGFDYTLVDWSSLWHSLINTSIVSGYGGFMGYLSKNFFSSQQGNILGAGDIPNK